MTMILHRWTIAFSSTFLQGSIRFGSDLWKIQLKI